VAAAALLTSSPLAAQRYDDLAAPVREFVVEHAPHVLLDNVRLIDGTGAPARTSMSVLISNGRIAAVGPAGAVSLPAGLGAGEGSVVDGSGATVLPGLVMLHEHMFYPSGAARYNTNEQSFPPLYLGGGVTTMRTGGTVDPYSDLSTRRLIDQGRIVGPKMDVTGPYLEGPDGFIRSFPQLATPDEARDHVNFWMDRGVTSFKAYNLITREVLKAAVDAAHARGAKVTGHLCSITYREAADLGIDNLEHGFFAATDWVQGKEPDQCPRGAAASYLALDLEGRDFLDVVDHLVERGVAITSTLNVVERRAEDRPPPPAGARAAMLPELRQRVMDAVSNRVSERGSALLERYMEMERIFFQRGGHLVVGTDPTGAGDVVPGYANQRSLQLLMEMGLSVEEAVMVATLNGARYLERDAEIGSVEQGKVADLVLLEGDPAVDPEALRRMRIVFKDGVGYDSAALLEAGSSGWVGVR
jgi:enamidase